MKSIGGYPEIHLNKNKEYHSDAVLTLNTARNALEYLLIAKSISKIYLPYYTCEVLLQPIIKIGIDYEFYSIDSNFEPVFNLGNIVSTHYFVYTNYFGLKSKYIKQLSNVCKNLIIDNAQAFYAKPIKNVDTLYSARKFFGVPDGAYLYTDKLINKNIEQDTSYERMQHLLKRADINPEFGYKDFLDNEKKLDDQNVKYMSNLTKKMLSNIDYANDSTLRVNNFKLIHGKLKNKNLFALKSLESDEIPFCYPFMTENTNLRAELVKNKVYTPIYWESVLKNVDVNSLESKFVNQIIHIPINEKINYQSIINIINEYTR
jgi:hypothetical protein